MPVLERLEVDDLRDVIVTYRDAMKAHQEDLNRLNVYPVPDGDTGTNMARTMDAVVSEMEQSPLDLEATCRAIAHGSLMGARGNSGVILSQILRGLVGTLERSADAVRGALGGHTVAEALEAAAGAAYKAVLKPVEGTILTVAREAAAGARAAADRGGALVDVLRGARHAGREALDDTPNLLPVLKEAGVVDAGGAGLVLLFDAALNVVAGDPLPEPEALDGPSESVIEALAHRGVSPGDGSDVSELRYEVMFFLDLDDEAIEAFKQAWGEIGDSIVVVGGEGLWNCHVHTNDIGAAVEAALDAGGRPRNIRVTDLFEEVVHHEHEVREWRTHAALPAVTTAVVAVCSGDGLADLFWQLGVQGIVSGGQTLNPSTAELVEAVRHVNAQQVVLLPNNKNIIPVAEQVDALSDKTVRVVRTRSMPEALAALVVYDPEADVDANVATMADAAESVATGEVTRAVRATSSAAGPIAEGDWIGLVRSEGIIAVSTSLLDAAATLLGHLVTPEREIVTVVTGADAPADVTDALVAWLADHHPTVQVEVHRGGQPLYPYLFGVE